MVSMNTGYIAERAAVHQRLEDKIAEYLASGGHIREIPTRITESALPLTEQRATRLRELAYEGVTMRQAAEQIGLSYEQTRRICSDYCVKFKRHRHVPEPIVYGQ